LAKHRTSPDEEAPASAESLEVTFQEESALITPVFGNQEVQEEDEAFEEEEEEEWEDEEAEGEVEEAEEDAEEEEEEEEEEVAVGQSLFWSEEENKKVDPPAAVEEEEEEEEEVEEDEEEEEEETLEDECEVEETEEDEKDDEMVSEEKDSSFAPTPKEEPAIEIPRPEKIGETQQEKTPKGEQPSLHSFDSDPDLIERGASLVIETGRASITMLQRKLQIRFAQASQLMDDLEKVGVVGPYRGSLAREIRMTADQWRQKQASIR